MGAHVVFDHAHALLFLEYGLDLRSGGGRIIRQALEFLRALTHGTNQLSDAHLCDCDCLRVSLRECR